MLWSLVAISFALIGAPLHADEQETHPTPAPYSRLRDATLEYNGPSEDFRNLTEVRIGWFAPSDSADAAWGDLWWAGNLAVEEANEKAAAAKPGTFDALPVRLVTRWATDPWKAGVSMLTRMVFDEKPLAVLGSVDSASTHLAEQVVAKVNLPLISPISTDKTATLAGVSWMFSCAPDSIAVAHTLGAAVDAEVKRTGGKLVMLTMTDHESRIIARDLARELDRLNRAPDFRFDLTPGVDLAPEAIQGTLDAKPSVVILVAGAEESARLARTLRPQLATCTFFGAPSLGRQRFIELAGPAAEGVHFPLLFDPIPGDATTARFVERFTAARKHAPDYTAAMTYDATRLLIQALRSAGPNRARLRETLAHGPAWQGIAGTIHFDGTGQNNRPQMHMGAIRDGAVIPLAEPDRSTSNQHLSK